MKFTSYDSSLIKAQGIPHLSVKEHARLMNIVFIEGAMHHLTQIRAEGEAKVNIGKMEYKLYAQLYNMTKKLTPKELIQEMVENSNDRWPQSSLSF